MSDSQKINVYVSFPITGVDIDEIKKVTAYMKSYRTDRFEYLDPLDNNHPLEGSYRSRGDAAKIVTDDFNMIREADLLIGIYTKPSVGQSMEILTAAGAHKMIILFIADEVEKAFRSNNFTMSPWLINFAYIIPLRAYETTMDGYARHGASEPVYGDIIDYP